jgi:hypothetical protein
VERQPVDHDRPDTGQVSRASCGELGGIGHPRVQAGPREQADGIDAQDGLQPPGRNAAAPGGVQQNPGGGARVFPRVQDDRRQIEVDLGEHLRDRLDRDGSGADLKPQ